MERGTERWRNEFKEKGRYTKEGGKEKRRGRRGMKERG